MKKTAAGKEVVHTATSDTEMGSASVPKLHVGREIADTTWRMTVPVVIFVFLGIFLDLRLGTKPWITFLGVIVGFYFAVVLIKKQLERSKDSSA